MKIEDLYFGIMRIDFNSDSLQPANLFDSLRVLHSVALYVAEGDYLLTADMDPLAFCFGDTAGRCEYEMLVSDLSGDNTEKCDIYHLYVEPNRQLLMDLVNSVDVGDAKRWLAQYCKERKAWSANRNYNNK